MRLWFFNLTFFLFLFVIACGGQHANYPSSEGSVVVGSQLTASFSSIKRKIFQSKCLSCHVKGEEAEDVPLDDLDQILISSRRIIVTGKPEESKLITAIKRTDSKQMPPSDSGIDRLTQQEISLIEEWIQKGAPP